MTVLLTGASGFMGLAISEALLARGEHVVGFDLACPPDAARRAFAGLPGRFETIAGDMRDADAVHRAVAESGAGRIIHLAAVTADANRERRDPGSVFAVNLCGTLNIIAAARAAGVGRIVHMSSGSVYGASGRLRTLLREDDTLLRPEGLYGISKQASEASALRLAALHDLDLVVGRLGTCFGPWEYATAARDTPSAPLQVLLGAMRGEEVALARPHWRDFLYSRDGAAATLALLDAQFLRHKVYNLAAGFVWSLEGFCAALAERRKGFAFRMAAPGNIAFYADYDRAAMDAARLKADTGFAPRFDLDAALDDYLPWFETNADLFLSAKA
ncbi:NAD dependent epimerase/dehydratase [Azorhizobium oxalatiphilum]|uniref:NAD dependent epimerase/dehydratase n=1 Tax=Azorhizobium oxalatiphilum TaxID=980631 RepID=A0A917C9C2_9HYPH|nr:NAD(P)-dependent oxidoreductase [Azorhizobium oxalatiphilum]GGF77877.1 NAD dependent epimerase/dehydratase [Azorhizobium oxalatiphilum]